MATNERLSEFEDAGKIAQCPIWRIRGPDVCTERELKIRSKMSFTIHVQ